MTIDDALKFGMWLFGGIIAGTMGALVLSFKLGGKVMQYNDIVEIKTGVQKLQDLPRRVDLLESAFARHRSQHHELSARVDVIAATRKPSTHDGE